MKHLAAQWAKDLGLTIKAFLGNGDNGEAYLTNDNRVIKITHDAKEFEIAEILAGEEHEHIVRIDKAACLDEDFYGILQERLKIDESFQAEMYEELVLESTYQNLSIVDLADLDEDDFTSDLSFQAQEMLEMIKGAFNEVTSMTGFIPSDIHFTNMGMNANEKLVVFDLRHDG